MSSVNQTILIGNLAKDVETRGVGASIMSKLVVATNRSWKTREGDRREETEFHDVICWSSVAELVASSHLAKGSKVYIQGYLKTREYTTEAGEKRSHTEIIAEKVIFLD